MKITKANIGNCKSIKTLEFKPSSNHRFPDRKLSTSSNKYEKLYEALWDDTLELRKKAGVMVSILGIILPLLITLYVNNQSTLNFDSNLFTIFFGTCLLIFIQYFGLFICLYNVPKYGIDWGNIDLDDKNIRAIPHPSKQDVSINNNWIEILKEQKTKYTFCQFFAFILDFTIISTLSILALYFLIHSVAGDPFSPYVLLLMFSFAISSCVACTILLIEFIILPEKILRKFKTWIYLIIWIGLTVIFWATIFHNAFI